MRGIRIILAGKIRKSFYSSAFDYYLQKVQALNRVDIIIVKDARSGSFSSRLEQEGRQILERTGSRDFCVVLDEKGKSFSSKKFSNALKNWEEDPGCSPCFIIGGAYGLSQKVRSRADLLMSFGPMTMPHELAAVVLIEQIYRAQTITRGHPYHH